MSKIFEKRELNFNFIRQRVAGYIFSAILLIVSVVSLWTQGLNYGIDFEGGILVEATSKEVVDLDKTRADLAFLQDLSIQTAGLEGKTILIQARPNDNENPNQLVEKIKATLGEGYSYSQVEMVGPTVGNELKYKSLWASVLALMAIAVYIWFRFEWPFAIGCLVSLAHDLIIVVGAFSLFQWEFDMVVVAGLLSLAGYDCNDSIVTYDRVRENLHKFRKLSTDDILNKSINETLSRTLLTSLTTLFVVLVLLIVGGETLRGFSIAMVLGTVFGTYSSIYVAVPLLRYFDIRNLGSSDDKAANA